MDRSRQLVATAFLSIAASLTACQPKPQAQAAPPAPKQQARVDAARLTAAASDGANWMTTGRTYDEQRHSPLKQVNADNVAQLGLAWHHDLDAVNRGQQATPIVVDGVMYVTSAWSKVFALDAKTGQQLWAYDPQVPGDWGINACCDVVNRGVAVWNGKVYVGTLDGRLVALDAATGKPVWDVLTIDKSKRYAISGAPRVVKGKVFIGNAGAEMGVRGYISAYDAETGKMLWRFFTVPGDPSQPFENKAMEDAAKTWKGTWWKQGGGGTVWDSMAYDPETDLLYFGTGNGTPWNQVLRSPGGGDNLFLSSIVAVKAETGEYVWHYQTTPGDDWDYDSTNHLILATLRINDQDRKVIMQASKNGVFYVLDRTTGEFISAKPFVNVTWATGFDPKTGRAIVNPAARYGVTGKTFVSQPGAAGGHAWHPMSFSPETGLVYIPALDLQMSYTSELNRKPSQYTFNIGYDFAASSLPQVAAIKAAAKAGAVGHLSAWDPVAQKEVWRVQYPQPWAGGVLSTAGNLVFQGTPMGEFIAYSADKGTKLWSAPTEAGVVAAPITYEVDGQQYVAVEVGYGGAFAIAAGEIARDKHAPTNTPRIMVFALGGKDALPAAPPVSTKPLTPPASTAAKAVVDKGFHIYHPYCSNCHGDAAVSGSFIPDLQHSDALSDPAVWDSIVLGGVRKSKGMVSFAAELSKEDVEAVRAYVIYRANQTVAEQKAAQKLAKPAG
jgi:alcohol dehydrogenase (cytochrome c)/quinohemoprotein ethanol dehydrogenase